MGQIGGVMRPETRYTKSGDVHIAYQVVGDGPIDLVFVSGWASHIEYIWEFPPTARALQRLASFSRLILFDKRGTGLSDRVPDADLPSLEQRMDDVRAVMDAVRSKRAALFGASEGGPMCMLFAATYPERTTALILYGSFPVRTWSPDYPWALTLEQQAMFEEAVRSDWAKGADLPLRNPGADVSFSEHFATLCRMSASPGAALTLLRMNFEIDVRAILPMLRVPTLILHRGGDLRVDVGNSRYMAERITGSKYVELPGNEHWMWLGGDDPVTDEIEEFLTGARHVSDADRVLATVLFTDIVGSTELAATLGDRRWRELLNDHHAIVRRELARFRGREVHTAGDGFLATFDGPARATRCALSITRAVRLIGLDVRAGVHTGEVELMGDDIGGIAVHTGARVAATAEAGEVLVSSTVRDLVAGSGIAFEDRGIHTLKGVPGEWQLFRALP